MSNPSQQNRARNSNRPYNGVVNNSINEKLGKLFKRTQARAYGQVTNRQRIHLIEVEDLVDDGVDHINVSYVAKTELGQLLSTSCCHKFKLFDIEFRSIDNMLLYFQMHCMIPEAAHVNLSGMRAIRRKAPMGLPRLRNIHALVCGAYFEIFKANPELIEALEQNQLPFDSYNFAEDQSRYRHLTKARKTIQAIMEAWDAIANERAPRMSLFFFNHVQRQQNEVDETEASIHYMMSMAPSVLQDAYAVWLKANPQPVAAPVAPPVKKEKQKKPKPVVAEAEGEHAIVDPDAVNETKTESLGDVLEPVAEEKAEVPAQ